MALRREKSEGVVAVGGEAGFARGGRCRTNFGLGGQTHSSLKVGFPLLEGQLQNA